ncbi:MAG: NAD(P)H-hydrate dehydratase [Eubacterium sp.]
MTGTSDGNNSRSKTGSETGSEKVSAISAADLLPKRARDTSKADYGNDVIFAGTSGMCGAAVLSALSALRSGAGLVRSATLRSNFTPIQTLAPEAICVEWEDALGDLSHYDAVAAGPGLGTSDDAKKIIKGVLADFTGPLVIDADGLNTIALGNTAASGNTAAPGNTAEPENTTAPGNTAAPENLGDAVRNTRASVIMTPHALEAARLLGSEPGKYDRRELAVKISEKYNCVCLSKGNGTVVRSPDGRTYVNTTGNPGMATPGSGDVLTGIITALAGQGIAPFEAAVLGCFIHGLAGDIACEESGERGLIARDIIANIPKAFMRAESGEYILKIMSE